MREPTSPHDPSPNDRAQKHALGPALGVFALGRLTSGLLGLVWLLLMTRHLDLPQLGVYFACIALFELLQLSSSLGVYFIAERQLPNAWASGERRRWTALIWRLAAWRAGTLAAALLALAIAMPWVSKWLGWPAVSPSIPLLVGWMFVGGMARLVETLLVCTLQQGFGQALNVARNVGRIAILLLLVWDTSPIDTQAVLRIELGFGLAYICAAASWFVWHWLKAQPSTLPACAFRLSAADRRFALDGWLALLVVQLSGADAIRLAVSVSTGPEGLALYGTAASLIETMLRYVPSALLYGYMRTWLSVGTRPPAAARRAAWRAGRLLTRASVLAVLPVMAGIAVFGADLATLAFPRLDPGELHLMLVLMSPLLLLQPVRLALNLTSQIVGDNRAVLHANLANLPVPALAFALVSVFGITAAALSTALLELIVIGMLWRRLGASRRGLLGRRRSWLVAAAVACVAAAAALVVRHSFDTPFSLPIAVGLFGTLAILLTSMTVRLERDERACLHHSRSRS